MDALGLIALSGGGSSGGDGTQVVANPTLVGTEEVLTGLQVGNEKYKIPNGENIYMHQLIFTGNDIGGLYINIFTSSENTFSELSVDDVLKSIFTNNHITGCTFFGKLVRIYDSYTDNAFLGICARYSGVNTLTIFGRWSDNGSQTAGGNFIFNNVIDRVVSF